MQNCSRVFKMEMNVRMRGARGEECVGEIDGK